MQCCLLLLSSQSASSLADLSLSLSSRKRSRRIGSLRGLRCLRRSESGLLLSLASSGLRLPQVDEVLRLLRGELSSRLPNLSERLHLLTAQLTNGLPERGILTRALQDAREIRAGHLASGAGKLRLPREIRLRQLCGLPVALLNSLRLLAQDRFLSVAQRPRAELTHATAAELTSANESVGHIRQKVLSQIASALPRDCVQHAFLVRAHVLLDALRPAGRCCLHIRLSRSESALSERLPGGLTGHAEIGRRSLCKVHRAGTLQIRLRSGQHIVLTRSGQRALASAQRLLCEARG